MLDNHSISVWYLYGVYRKYSLQKNYEIAAELVIIQAIIIVKMDFV